MMLTALCHKQGQIINDKSERDLADKNKRTNNFHISFLLGWSHDSACESYRSRDDIRQVGQEESDDE